MPTPSAGRRLLLVEDEGAFRELLCAFLEAEGYGVYSVGDGGSALRWLKANPVDMVITDLCMPDSDGMELLMALRKIRSTGPIIVISGGVGAHVLSLLRAAVLLGARRTLAKPFSLQELAKVVRDVLR